jgi:hypothetical protein
VGQDIIFKEVLPFAHVFATELSAPPQEIRPLLKRGVFFEKYYWSIGKFYNSEIYKLILKL